MYILKLQRLGNLKLWGANYDKNFHEGYLLSEFLEDFGDRRGIEWCKEFINDPHRKSTGGNVSGLDKLDNNKLVITNDYSTTPNYQLILDADVLLKVMELFNQAANTCPKEIIISFDENLQNPTIETVS